MAVLVLGRPVVRSDEAMLRPARRMARVLLGVFALRPNRMLSLDWLIDGLWSGHPPASAAANLRSHITELRRLLGPNPSIRTASEGYELVASPADVDALRFKHLVEQGRGHRAAGADAEAARCLSTAVELWRGDVLEGVAVPAVVQAEAVVLEDMRMSAIEELVDVRLLLGQHHDLVPQLKGLVVEYPLRERLWHQLLLALWADGRRTEVLDAYRRLSLVLDTELGVGPCAATTELHEMVRRSQTSR
ncbi:AfsR/SARP family transcriptional regulator [Lentzea tibetensis]|uniref:AfsR/SARP family transcriptional regulator n=1 Tax=Lentzea tibetensis TaxID=2591470 RepID=A0A563ESZ5_9PSEU|nr:AfsR/SARP family transcriptional regulator [Lentzea tibetensis]TWP50658.1 AfsR/SARP family transcriptional regulator [Lentzea tibetensis]